MQISGWAISMGLGAAVGAVAVSMLPRNSKAKLLVDKAANTVEDAAAKVADKVTRDM